MPTDADAPLTLLLNLTVTQRELAREVEFTLAQYHGLSLIDLSVLRAIAGSDAGVPRAELAAPLALSVSNLVRILSPLQRLGIIDQEPTDGGPTATVVNLTGAGVELTANASRTAREAAGRVLGRRWNAPQQSDLAMLLTP
jgi:DNA-binding MarR family transcriptional regulator